MVTWSLVRLYRIELITGENLLKENATKYLDMVYRPTVQRGIPFSSTFGNVHLNRMQS
jgi:hypothetical protein